MNLPVPPPLALAALLALLAPGCVLLPPGELFDDDDATSDDDDATADDDDATSDDDDATEPPCEYDPQLPGSVDADGDGWPATSPEGPCDCNDVAPATYPGAAEVFDLVVQDCDAAVEIVPTSRGDDDAPGGAGVLAFPGGAGFGSAVSWGSRPSGAFACVRSGAWVRVAFGLGEALGVDEIELAHIGPFAIQGDVICGHDLDGDGVDDVAVSSWGGANGDPAGVYVFSGESLEADASLSPDQANASWLGGPGAPLATQVGVCLGAGELDLNREGAELFVGSDGAATSGFAALWVAPGADVEPLRDPAEVWSVGVLGSWTFPDDQPPSAVRCAVVGDLDGGGLDDLVLREGSSGTTRVRATEQGIGPTGESDMVLPLLMRTAISLDLDGDGARELALGAPGGADDAGWGVVVRGDLRLEEWPQVGEGDVGLPLNPGLARHFAGLDGGGVFGSTVCDVGDIDGDGRDDVLFTDPGGGDGWSGEAYLYLGRPWEDWGFLTQDDQIVDRGAEDTRFVSEPTGSAFGLMTRCEVPPRARTSHLMIGAPLLDQGLGGIWWWANQAAVEVPPPG